MGRGLPRLLVLEQYENLVKWTLRVLWLAGVLHLVHSARADCGCRPDLAAIGAGVVSRTDRIPVRDHGRDAASGFQFQHGRDHGDGILTPRRGATRRPSMYWFRLLAERSRGEI